jgi:chromosome segregation ATPase
MVRGYGKAIQPGLSWSLKMDKELIQLKPNIEYLNYCVFGPDNHHEDLQDDKDDLEEELRRLRYRLDNLVEEYNNLKADCETLKQERDTAKSAMKTALEKEKRLHLETSCELQRHQEPMVILIS